MAADNAQLFLSQPVVGALYGNALVHILKRRQSIAVVGRLVQFMTCVVHLLLAS